jgi:hypothetical protein
MTIFLRSSRLIMAAACVCFALAVSPFAHGQATPTANQQKQNAQPAPPILGLYDLFLEYVGNKDEQIQAGIEGGKAQITPRQDYAAAIGISEGEAQIMLAILIDAFHQGGGSYKDQIVAHLKLVREYGPDEGERMYDEEKATYGSRKYTALKGAVAKLQTELSEESFAKLNRFVVEKQWATKATKEPLDPDPCPPNNNPPPGQTTHVACTQVYVDFFHGTAWRDKSNQTMEANGDGEKPMVIDMPIAMTGDKKQAVIDIAVDEERQINENDQQYRKQADQFFRPYVARYGAKGYATPLPPEIEALRKNRGRIIEEHIFMLRQELGDDSFKRFDSVLAQMNVTIAIQRRQLEVQSPASVPASEQAPAAQP